MLTDDLLNLDDIELLKKMQIVKKSITTLVKKSKIIDLLKDKINNSELVNFIDDRSRKFISVNRPIFSIMVDKEKSMSAYNHHEFKDDADESSFYSQVVHDEILSKFAEELDKLIKELNDENVKLGLEELPMELFIFSSITRLTLDETNKNIINLEFLL